MSSPAFDLLIVGAGPAGLTAATEVANAGFRCLALDKLAPGGVLINLAALHDYSERREGSVTGADFAAELTDTATAAGVELGFGEVSKIGGDGRWTIETADGESHGARLVLVATGLNKGRLGLPNEQEFEGRGLSHCAACDGPLYAGQPVVITGGSPWVAQEIHELQPIVGSVTLIDDAATAVPPDVTRIAGRIVGLEGKDGLAAVVVDTGQARKSIPASAAFIYVNQTPAAEFLPETLARDASGHIVVDDDCRTSLPTVFAVGDVRSGSRPLLSAAIADGRRAAKAIIAALNGRP